jgi:hypothetical protein
MSKGSDMLLDAARTIAERGRVYGEARANMERTAQLWSIVLGVPVTPVQVALCLIQLKEPAPPLPPCVNVRLRCWTLGQPRTRLAGTGARRCSTTSSSASGRRWWMLHWSRVGSR